MPSAGILRSVALVRTDVSEELSASFIRVTRIGELETTIAVTSNRRTLRGFSSAKVAAAFRQEAWRPSRVRVASCVWGGGED
jgi:hypothetical protein